MSIQPIPPTSGATTAGQLVSRAYQNDQALAALLGELEDRALTYTSVMRDRGAYSHTQDYDGGDVVTHDGSRWYAADTGSIQITERTNHLDNPRFVNNRAGWTVNPNATGTIDGTTAHIELTGPRGIAQAIFHTATGAPTSEGDVWSVAVDLSVPADVAAPLSLDVHPSFFPIPPSNPSRSRATINPGETVTLKCEGVAVPAGKTEARFFIDAGQAVDAGVRFSVSNPIMEKATTVGPYFDGSKSDTSSDVYEWLGTPDDSPSRATSTRWVPVDLGNPGVDPRWVRLGAAESSTGPDQPGPPREFRTWTPTVEFVAGGLQPHWLSQDRVLMYNGDAPQLRQSWDEGRTWENVPSPWSDDVHVVASIHDMDNGELVVTTSGTSSTPGGDDGCALWVSSGYDRDNPSATTWTRKIEPRAHRTRFVRPWSMDVHGAVILAAEYGPKQGQPDVDPGGNARYLHLSTNYGRTFSTILDLNALPGLTTSDGLHLHGVAWDSYWDRIWVTFGDDNNGIIYSDDLGASWQVAFFHGAALGYLQATSIAVLPGCVLFGSDDHPDGIYRIDRAPGRDGPYELEVAHVLHDTGSRNLICHGMRQVTKVGGAPLFAIFGREDTPGYPSMVATWDGFHFETVWTSDHYTPAGRGPRSVMGPTLSGQVVVSAQDDRSPGQWSIYRGQSPA